MKLFVCVLAVAICTAYARNVVDQLQDEDMELNARAIADNQISGDNYATNLANLKKKTDCPAGYVRDNLEYKNLKDFVISQNDGEDMLDGASVDPPIISGSSKKFSFDFKGVDSMVRGIIIRCTGVSLFKFRYCKSQTGCGSTSFNKDVTANIMSDAFDAACVSPGNGFKSANRIFVTILQGINSLGCKGIYAERCVKA